jgi:hypothetical protein
MLQRKIYEITQIPIAALHGAFLSDFSINERMRWAVKRNTKRKEDKAYYLLGIFDVFISPIYGKREHAFVRLKDEINRSCRSQLDGIEYTFAISNSYDLDNYNAESTPIAVEEISLYDRRKTLLTSLDFDQMDSRRSTIKSVYSTTCEWLLKHPAYAD